MISLGGITYFVMIAVVMLYISMVLIGRRHWQAREEGGVLLGHYLVRAIALLAVAAGVTMLIQNRNWLRADVSTEQLSSLSGDTQELIDQLRANDDVTTVKIDAYISPQVPTEFTSTKLNLISTLEELRALGRGKIVVERHEIPTYGPEADLAAKNFGIKPQEQSVIERGEAVSEEFFLGFAVTSGLDKVVTPFLNKGIPVEYELVRSIMTVAGNKRLRVGIVDTGLTLMGSGDGSRTGEWPLVTELRKQYDVVSVDPAQAITGRYDVLLGDPAVDARTRRVRQLRGRDSRRHAHGGARGSAALLLRRVAARHRPAEAIADGDVRHAAARAEGRHQRTLEAAGHQERPDAGRVSALQPRAKRADHARSAVGVHRPRQPAPMPFNETSRGHLRPQSSFVSLSRGTGEGRRLAAEVRAACADGRRDLRRSPGDDAEAVRRPRRQHEQNRHPLRIDAARATSSRPTSPASRPRTTTALADAAALDDAHDPADDPEAKADAAKQKDMNVIVVADIDWVIPSFFQIREGGDEHFLPVTQNVPFILNIIDELAGDDRFMEIRKRARLYRTLTRIDEATRDHREQAEQG